MAHFAHNSFLGSRRSGGPVQLLQSHYRRPSGRAVYRGQLAAFSYSLCAACVALPRHDEDHLGSAVLQASFGRRWIGSGNSPSAYSGSLAAWFLRLFRHEAHGPYCLMFSLISINSGFVLSRLILLQPRFLREPLVTLIWRFPSSMLLHCRLHSHRTLRSHTSRIGRGLLTQSVSSGSKADLSR